MAFLAVPSDITPAGVAEFAAGAHVMLVDTEKREFVPAGGWVEAF